jgi:hypothetical protein
MLSFKAITAPNGLPGWRVSAGANVLGTVFNPGPSEMSGMSWHGVAPDGKRFAATSRPKLAQKLLIHASADRMAPVRAATSATKAA